MLLKLLYTLFLGLLIALFVGLGIDAFYPGPKMPDYPVSVETDMSKFGCQISEEQKAEQVKYDQDMKNFNDASKPYNRNVSIISLAFAIVILVASLTLFTKIKMMADGILLGGVFTAAYSIIRGLMSQDTKFRFLIVTFGLIIVLVLGYIKFIRPRENQEKEI